MQERTARAAGGRGCFLEGGTFPESLRVPRPAGNFPSVAPDSDISFSLAGKRRVSHVSPSSLPCVRGQKCKEPGTGLGPAGFSQKRGAAPGWAVFPSCRAQGQRASPPGLAAAGLPGAVGPSGPRPGPLLREPLVQALHPTSPGLGGPVRWGEGPGRSEAGLCRLNATTPEGSRPQG